MLFLFEVLSFKEKQSNIKAEGQKEEFVVKEPTTELIAPIKKRKKWRRIGRVGSRTALGSLFVLCLCFFLQFREAKVDILELHAVSKQYIVSQITFEVPDEEKTFFLQQQAMREIGSVYRFDPKEVHAIGNELEEQFAQNKSFQKKLPEVQFEQLYEYTEAFENFLLESRLSDEKTVSRLIGSEIPPGYAFILPPLEEDSISLEIPAEFWISVRECVFGEEGHGPLALFISEFFTQKKWFLQKDTNLEKQLQQAVKDRVPQQYALIQAGSFILEPGETITLKHIRFVQALKNALGETVNRTSIFTLLGSLILSVIIAFLTIIYLKIYHKDIYKSLRRLTLLTVIAIMTLLTARAVEYLLVYKGYSLIETIRVPLVVPFASLLLCVLLGARIALFSSIFLSVIISLSVSIEYDRFLVLNLIASMCTIVFARSLHRRKDIFEVCAKVWICCVPVLIAFHLRENNFWDVSLAVDVVISFAFMMIAAMMIIGFLPLFEAIFNIMTDMSMMEYMDPNSELLRRLSLEAPGTYQHSLVVGNFAEVAARAIGANDLFCRVAALYHDIGKLSHPHYFTENQLGGFNIHQLLTPLESNQVIISHVAEGEVLAKRYRLPKSFINIIREHHGTTLVYFFYCKQIEQMDGEPARVNESLFRYLGPKPQTKESALIMIADTIEAASRSLDEVTEDVVMKMVDRLISEKVMEGQFDECLLSFKELCTAKKAIVKALLISRHLRIKYPDKMLKSPLE